MGYSLRCGPVRPATLPAESMRAWADRNPVVELVMSDVSALSRSLALIDQAALQAILDPQDGQRLEALCGLIAEHKPVVAIDHRLGEMDAWRQKLLGIFGEIVSAAESARRSQEPQRARLIVSYLRTMRSFIAKLQPALPATKSLQA